MLHGNNNQLWLPGETIAKNMIIKKRDFLVDYHDFSEIVLFSVQKLLKM